MTTSQVLDTNGSMEYGGRNRIHMVKHIKISLYKTGKKAPETKVIIPLVGFHIGQKLMPVKIKDALEDYGINLTEFCEKYMSKSPPKGELISIESQDHHLEISIE